MHRDGGAQQRVEALQPGLGKQAAESEIGTLPDVILGRCNEHIDGAKGGLRADLEFFFRKRPGAVCEHDLVRLVLGKIERRTVDQATACIDLFHCGRREIGRSHSLGKPRRQHVFGRRFCH